jgi:hypothetical protein
VAAPVLGSEAELYQGLDRPGATKQRIGKLEQGILAGIQAVVEALAKPGQHPERVDSREMGEDTGHGDLRLRRVHRSLPACTAAAAYVLENISSPAETPRSVKEQAKEG